RWTELRATLEQGLARQAPDLEPISTEPFVRWVKPTGPLDADLGGFHPLYWDQIIFTTIRLLGGQPLYAADDAPAAAIIELGQVPDRPEARSVFMVIVDGVISELEAILEVQEECEAADAAKLADRLSFDESEEGEQLRRFQMSCS